MVENESHAQPVINKTKIRNGEIKMTNETNVNETVEAVKVEAKPKRVRRVTPKVEKTAIQIIEELNALEADVVELENAIGGIAQDNAAYAIVEKALNDKKAEFEAARTQVYFS